MSLFFDKIACCKPATLLKIRFDISFLPGILQNFSGQLFYKTSVGDYFLIHSMPLHCVKYTRIGFSFSCIFVYKDRIYNWFWYGKIQVKGNSYYGMVYTVLVSPYTIWKYQKTSGFLIFSGGAERENWHEMGQQAKT